MHRSSFFHVTTILTSLFPPPQIPTSGWENCFFVRICGVQRRFQRRWQGRPRCGRTLLFRQEEGNRCWTALTIKARKYNLIIMSLLPPFSFMLPSLVLFTSINVSKLLFFLNVSIFQLLFPFPNSFCSSSPPPHFPPLGRCRLHLRQVLIEREIPFAHFIRRGGFPLRILAFFRWWRQSGRLRGFSHRSALPRRRRRLPLSRLQGRYRGETQSRDQGKWRQIRGRGGIRVKECEALKEPWN